MSIGTYSVTEIPLTFEKVLRSQAIRVFTLSLIYFSGLYTYYIEFFYKIYYDSLTNFSAELCST